MHQFEVSPGIAFDLLRTTDGPSRPPSRTTAQNSRNNLGIGKLWRRESGR